VHGNSILESITTHVIREGLSDKIRELRSDFVTVEKLENFTASFVKTQEID
jgi:hypothetical protein